MEISVDAVPSPDSLRIGRRLTLSLARYLRRQAGYGETQVPTDTWCRTRGRASHQPESEQRAVDGPVCFFSLVSTSTESPSGPAARQLLSNLCLSLLHPYSRYHASSESALAQAGRSFTFTTSKPDAKGSGPLEKKKERDRNRSSSALVAAAITVPSLLL